MQIDQQERSPLHAVALFLLMTGIWISVFSAGGYFPFGRFLTLAAVSSVFVLLVFEPVRFAAQTAHMKTWTLLLLGLIAIAALQVLPISSELGFQTSVQKIRSEFGGANDGFSFTLSPWRSRTRLSLLTIGIGGFFAASVLLRNRRARVVLLSAVTLCGVLQVFWAVVQAVRYPNFIFWGIENPGTSRPLGTFLNCNHGADFVGIALACAVGLSWWWFRDESRGNSFEYEMRGLIQSIAASPFSMALWLSIGWLLIGLAISMSRGAWISFIAAGLLLPVCWKSQRKERKGVAITIVAVCIIGAIAGIQTLGFGDRIERGLDDLEVETVLADARFEHWKEAIPAAQHFLPLGAGFGTYGYSYLPFNPKPANGWFTYAHNQYLETMLEAGIPGMALLLIAMWLLLRACLRLCNSERTATEQAIGVAGLIAFAMQGFHAFTDFGLMMPGNLLVFCTLMGGVVGTASTVADSTPEEGVKEARRPWFGLCTGLITLAFSGVALAVATWHQMADVRGDRILTETLFDPATPAPSIDEVGEWIESVTAELSRSPENEDLIRRLVQLRLHRAQRQSYEQMTSAGVSYASAWDAASIETTIMRLYQQDSLTDEEKSAIYDAVKADESLAAALNELETARALNPLQSRTHYRLAQLLAVRGEEWETEFEHSARLSVVDPKQSLGNGLLAWAAGDKEAMTGQWRQTLQTNPSARRIILRLSALMMSDSEIANELMPDRWVVPYRLALEAPKDSSLRSQLLERAKRTASKTLSNQAEQKSAFAMIAQASGEVAESIQYLEDLVTSNARDPELRYRLAHALLVTEQSENAMPHARIAVNLKPNSEKYRRLFARIEARVRAAR